MAEDFLLNRYKETSAWQEKVLIVKLYHDYKKVNGHWTITQTAQYFSISIGLVSENIRIATVLGQDDNLWKIETRQKALEIIERRREPRFRFEDDNG